MSRSYKKLDDYSLGYDDPEDVRYIGSRGHGSKQSKLKQPRLPPKPSNQWLPHQFPIVDPDWDNED